MTSREDIANLAEKVSFLSEPPAYRHATSQVEALETHMSWVFLTDNRVYKLKKPVRHAFLDFSTIAKRRFFCGEELRLNRRLAAETYRQVVPLCRDDSGEFALGGEGRIVDWLVEMNRLPQADMLDERIQNDRVTVPETSQIGKLLADFYAGLESETTDGDGYLRHMVTEQRINRIILLRPEFGLADIAAEVLVKVDNLLQRARPWIEARFVNGAIIECHGDLRPEHVCLVQPPQIIDCLEFNRSMRIMDPYDEINYLGMECDMLGASWIRPLLNHALDNRLSSRPDPPLLALYGGFRALLRARLCIAHLLETSIRHAKKWRPLAIRYIRQAHKECLILDSEQIGH